jgi:RimJ/RimL family protein N-acetyltransferase
VVVGLLEDRGVDAVADLCRDAGATIIEDLDADRAMRQQAGHDRANLTKPHPNRAVIIVAMQWLAPTIADVPGDHDLAVIAANDTRAARQLDQNGGHSGIVAPLTTQRRRRRSQSAGSRPTREATQPFPMRHHLLGAVGLGEISLPNARAAVGNWPVPKARGHRLAAEALGLLDRPAMSSTLEPRRPELHIAVENLAQTAARNAGDRHEDTLRPYMYAKDRRWDVAMWATVRDRR